MSNNVLAGITSHFDKASSDWKEVLKHLTAIVGPNGETLNLDQPITGSGKQITLHQLDKLLTGLFELSAGLKDALSDLLVPDSLINDLSSASGDVRTKIASILGALQGVISKPITGIEPQNYNATNSGGAQLNISSILPNLRDAAQSALLHTQLALCFTRTTGGGSLASQIEEISESKAELRRATSDAHRTKKAFEAALARLSPIESSATEAKNKIDGLNSSAQRTLSQIEELLTSSTSLHQKINEANTKAATLETSVSSFNEKFIKFDADLSQRDSQFITGKQAFDELSTKLTKAMEEVERLQVRSRDVLGEATVAGLSERFEKEKNSIDSQMRWAQGLFFAGVALFLLSAMAATGAIPWLEAGGYFQMPRHTVPIDPTAGEVIIFLLTVLLGKITLLLPSLFLLGFSIKWYSEQFRLRAQYAYKYTVAASLPGFKIEADEYANAMTASAFKELLFNPAEGKPSNREDEKSSWFEKLIAPTVAKKVEEMMSSVTDKKPK